MGTGELVVKAPMSFYDRYRPLLERRVPADEIELGRAYVIHARNGGVGVAARTDGRLAYRLHREKSGRHFLFDEWDWDEGELHGTAIPLRRIASDPPADPHVLLEWLAEREADFREEIDAAWEVVLGFHPSRLRERR